MILLKSDLSQMTPGQIVLVIVVFAVLAILVVASLKEQNQSYINLVKKLYDGKILEGNYECFISANNELVVKYRVANFGANIYKLDKVAYVMTYYSHQRGGGYWEFGLFDIDKKFINCLRVVSEKEQPKMKAMSIHTNRESADYMWQLVHKYVPNARRVGMRFEDYAG